MILINGPSSAGKSTLVNALHDHLSSSSPYARVAFDDFLQHMNTRYYPRLYVETVRGDVNRLVSRGYDGKAGWEYVYDSPDRCRLVFNEHGTALMKGLHRGWKAHLECGTSLVIDAFLQDEEWARDLMEQIQCAESILMVGAYCDVDELARREKERGDRPLGLARRSSELVHTHGLRYDITVNLTDTTLFEENVQKILTASCPKTMCLMSATGLARRIRDDEVTCGKLLEIFIERVESSKINAVVVKGYERARARAEQLDAAKKEGKDIGPLGGVPCTVKESFRVRGILEPTNGYRRTETICETSDRAVELLEAAGAVIFGKTNLPLRSADVQTFNSIFGQTDNPWDATKTPGGSSGGSAAAVAARLTPFCLGTDIGGSIRVPASHCAVFGHKTTFDIIPPKGSQRARDLSVIGPIAHSPEDLELVLNAIATGPKPSYLRLTLPQPSTSERLLKVAFFPLDDVVISASVRKAMVDLKESVAKTMDAEWRAPEVDYDDMLNVYFQLLAASNTKNVRERLVERKDTYEKLWRQGEVFTDSLEQTYKEWSRADQHRDAICDAFSAFFREYDCLVAPCYPTPPPPHDHSTGDALYEGTSDEPFWRPGPRTLTMEDGVTKLPYNQAVFWAALASLTKLPSTSFPVSFDTATDLLPIGLQVIGPEGHDLLTIQVAQLLSPKPRNRLPPIN